ncbi:MAG: metallophosphoesterase [Gammaproteobacteria bacterium]
MIHLNQYDDNRVTLEVNDKRQLDFHFTLQLASTSAIILYPSLCTPVVCNGREPVRLLLLTRDSFHATYGHSQQQNNQQCERLVQRFLHVRDWPRGGPTPKPDAQDNGLLYRDMDSALANMTVHYLGTLDKNNRLIRNSQNVLLARLDTFAVDFYHQHGFQHLFEVELRQFPALSPCKGKKLIDLSWIELDGDAASPSAALQDPQAAHPFYEKQDDLLLAFHQQRIRSGQQYAYQIRRGELIFEPDTQRPLQAHHPVFFSDKDCYNFGHLTDVHVSSRHHVFDRSNASIVPGVGNLSGSERIGDRAHRSFDALYNLMKNFGTNIFTDGIVFTGDLIDYNRNYNPGCAQGKAINNTAALWQAMNLDNVADDDQYPAGIDNLIFFTLVRWFYDTYQKPIFLCAGNHEAYSVPYGISPRVVTPIKDLKDTILNAPDEALDLIDRISRIVRFNTRQVNDLQKKMDKKNKPVNGTRANEGIPADHNLTVYEACLMFGRQYHRVLMSGFKPGHTTRNFQPDNLDWFQLIFTPFTDFSYHWPKQTLSLLAWGDDEVFIDPVQGGIRNPSTRDNLREKGEKGIAFSPSALPRATRAIDSEQRQLLDAAIAQNKPLNVLASHFTLVNYHTAMSLLDEGDVSASRVGNGLGYFDWGTFEANREYLYHELLGQQKIQASLSGHSHRAGVYQLQQPVKRTSHHIYKWLRKVWLPTSIPESLDNNSPQVIGDYSVRAALPAPDNGDMIKSFPQLPADRAPIVVSACGGPIAVQNYCDELAGLGMERPSGSLLRFDEKPGQPTVKVLAATTQRRPVDTAKPRFCVATEFIDLLKGDLEDRDSGVFDLIRLYKPDDNGRGYGIHVQFADRMPKADLIAGARLSVFVQGIVEHYTLTCRKLAATASGEKSPHDNQYWLGIVDSQSSKGSIRLFELTLERYMKERNDDKRKAFLSLQFKSLAGIRINGHRVFQQYDFESPWVIPVLIEPDNKRVRLPKQASTRVGDMEFRLIKTPYYPIVRHPVWGEIPQFGWYEKTLPNEYGGKKSVDDSREK